MRLPAVLIAVPTALALTLPPAALAAAPNGVTNPFSPGLPSAPATAPTASTPTITNPTATPSTSGGGLGSGSALGIGLGAIALLAGISFFIWRDARRRAPVRHRPVTAASGNGSRPGSKRIKPRKLSPAERRRRKRGRAR